MVSARDYQFFYDYAGFNYDPKTETPEEGRRRCAFNLAEAEEKARNDERRVYFQWDIDPDIDSSDFDDENPVRELYICKMYVNGHLGSCLGGIDLDPNNPFVDPYLRVVEAELALELED